MKLRPNLLQLFAVLMMSSIIAACTTTNRPPQVNQPQVDPSQTNCESSTTQTESCDQPREGTTPRGSSSQPSGVGGVVVPTQPSGTVRPSSPTVSPGGTPAQTSPSTGTGTGTGRSSGQSNSAGRSSGAGGRSGFGSTGKGSAVS